MPIASDGHSHHAIIPTKLANFALSQLDRQEREIYFMIRDRYIAQFYPDYEYDATVIQLKNGEQLFKARGQVLKVQGWKHGLKAIMKTKNHLSNSKTSQRFQTAKYSKWSIAK